MNTRPLSTDRAADIALRAVAAVNWLFVAIILGAVVLASTQLRAATPVCGGTNLVAELARDDPDLFAAIRAEADATENGQSRLWRVVTPNGDAAPSFLFGTMHLTDPRVVDLGQAAQAAFDEAETVVIESTDVLDQAAMVAAMTANPELTMFTDSTTLRSLIATEHLPMVEEALLARGIPLSSINKMKPWIVSALVALPACEFDRKAAGEPVLDIMLAHNARQAGKRVLGLESMAEQLGAMASLPMDLHIEGLVETLRLGDQVDDVLETMVALYVADEIGMFWPFFRAVLPSGEDGTGYAAFEETMVTTRNHVMAERAGPILDEGSAFVAVGALHLPGPQGLVALLREAGYDVSAMPR